MGIKFLIGCDKCGVEVEKEIVEEGNFFLGIAENGFVVRVTNTFPKGWRGINTEKIICSYCVQGLESPRDEVEIICQKCNKVGIIIPNTGKNIKGDIDEEIRRVASTYEFKEYELMKFYCASSLYKANPDVQPASFASCINFTEKFPLP